MKLQPMNIDTTGDLVNEGTLQSQGDISIRARNIDSNLASQGGIATAGGRARLAGTFRPVDAAVGRAADSDQPLRRGMDRLGLARSQIAEHAGLEYRSPIGGLRVQGSASGQADETRYNQREPGAPIHHATPT